VREASQVASRLLGPPHWLTVDGKRASKLVSLERGRATLIFDYGNSLSMVLHILVSLMVLILHTIPCLPPTTHTRFVFVHIPPVPAHLAS
jgi:hypothetical protein